MDSDYPQYAKFGTYDHNFVINGIGFREAAILQSKATGIRLTCFTDQPGMQLYVADSTIPTDGKGGRHYAANTSVCLETQHFPDSINHPDFPDTVLRPGDTFRSKTLYHFSVF
jgi:aldose 1-epimerase